MREPLRTVPSVHRGANSPFKVFQKCEGEERTQKLLRSSSHLNVNENDYDHRRRSLLFKEDQGQPEKHGFRSRRASSNRPGLRCLYPRMVPKLYKARCSTNNNKFIPTINPFTSGLHLLQRTQSCIVQSYPSSEFVLYVNVALP